MAWYKFFYRCTDCGASWEDEWSCRCDDQCPECQSHDWSPYKFEDLTEVVCETAARFAVYRSPDTADDRPRYAPVAYFPSRELAMRFVVDGELT